MPKVFITAKIPDAGINLLTQQGYEIEFGTLKEAKGSDALLSQLEDNIDGKVLDYIGSQLRIVANYAVGYDNFDLNEFAKRNIIATNTPGVLSESVAEHTVGLLLALARKIVEADMFTRSGKYKGFDPNLFVGSELDGKVLGLVGHGRIGCRVADILQKAFHMKVLYYDSFRDSHAEEVCGITYNTLEDLLKNADIVTIHVPSLPSTRHLISERELKFMKSSAYLINTARGVIIDELALVRALASNQIKGAALDVFEFEPKLASGLAKLRNVLLTPHIASATVEARTKMAEVAASNIVAVLSGKPPINPIK